MSDINLIDEEKNFPNSIIMKILNTLKPAVIAGLQTSLSM
jgi:hypothetical protein